MDGLMLHGGRGGYAPKRDMRDMGGRGGTFWGHDGPSCLLNFRAFLGRAKRARIFNDKKCVPDGQNEIVSEQENTFDSKVFLCTPAAEYLIIKEKEPLNQVLIQLIMGKIQDGKD